MSKRTSTPARILAVIALIAAFVLAIVVIGGAVGDGGSDGSEGRERGGKPARTAEPKRRVPATYEIQSGDTLVAIARSTGVPLARIEALNPLVDPQILIAGETLKLR